MLDLTALRFTVFSEALGSYHVPTVLDLIVASCCVFGEGDRRSPKLRTLSILIGVVAIMVLIDRASEDDSNGG